MAQGGEVLDVLRRRRSTGSAPGRRTDGARVVVAIEGGGMRGTISAGMTLALHESGLLDALDGVYAASAGAISGAWLLSAEPERICGWTDERWARALIRRSNIIRGKPLVDVSSLIEDVYIRQYPLDYRSVLANPVTFHPLATDCATGAAVDLNPLIHDEQSLRAAIRASAALPALAGGPVPLGGRLWTDAGVAEPLPFRTPIAQGATHLLVLRTRRKAQQRPDDITGWQRGLLRAVLRCSGHPAAVASALDTRMARSREDEAALLSGSVDAHVTTVWPPDDAPEVSRLQRDGATLHAAFEAGRAAFHACFA